MAKKYKIKITKAYYIAIEDENGYEVAYDWSFLDYTETKKIAEKMLAEVERSMSTDKFGGEVAVTMDMLEDTCVDLLNRQEFISVAKDCHFPMTEEQDPKEIEKELEKCKGKLFLLSKGDCYKDYEEYIYENGEWCLIGRVW